MLPGGVKSSSTKVCPSFYTITGRQRWFTRGTPSFAGSRGHLLEMSGGRGRMQLLLPCSRFPRFPPFFIKLNDPFPRLLHGGAIFPRNRSLTLEQARTAC